ncbi:GTP-binding protein [Mycoplasmopsis cynos]|uniref:GTP-binding protein n=1 Tax=Mycoplasmopsis cynos TaxID=171284 RepID=UPI0024C7AE0A|nr:GTP-binding protein [Mycoplasmopsis cynos]WAM05193.1 GTP-binding protein [Mycoplasmopsis cynos]
MHKIGETHDGVSQMDWMEQEKERGITITSAATTAFWKGKRINIIDTPGHVDFTVEVERSLRVLDGAVAVLDAQSGVEPQTETVWRQATNYKVPRIVYVNKMDKVSVLILQLQLLQLNKDLEVMQFAIQWPIGAESDFKGLVDLVTLQAYTYNGEPQEEEFPTEIPEDLKDIVQIKRQELLEAVASFDDELMMDVLDGKDVDVNVFKDAIRKATLTSEFFL